MMLRKLAFAIIALMLSQSAFAQPMDRAPHIAAMQKLGFLVGDWTGSGVFVLPNGTRAPFKQSEHIVYKHDGTLLLIEGNGKNDAGATVHDALGVMTFDPAKNLYRMRSFAAVGRFADTEVQVSENKLVWGFDAGPQKFRYTLTVENGLWREIGERSLDGATWVPFIEMTLKKAV